jgi:formylglycine-generating enzyme required for sulfatase activity
MAYADASSSQWYNVCSSGGVNAYTYGNTYNGPACNDYDFWGGTNYTTLPVGHMTDCHGPDPYAGVFDMTGNVTEWEDSCSASTGETDNCRLRGGTFGAAQNVLGCNYLYTLPRNTISVAFGFRCCT